MTNAERYIGDEDTIDTFIKEMTEHLIKHLDGFFEEDTDYVSGLLVEFFQKPIQPTLKEDERVILSNIELARYDKIGRKLGGALYLKENRPHAMIDSSFDDFFQADLFNFIVERRRILYWGTFERRKGMTEHMILYKLKHKLVHDISMTTKKLHTHEYGENYINDYRRIRMKGMCTKSKEILDFIEKLEKNGEEYNISELLGDDK